MAASPPPPPDGGAPFERADAALVLGLAALAAAFILPGLGAQALANWDESTYGVLARELLRAPGLTLHYGGAPFFEKPPLGIWAMAFSARLLGLHEAALRLPAALSGIVAVVFTFLAGRRLAGRAAGLIAALLLLGVPHFVAWSRLAMLDVPLLAFGTLAVACVVSGDEHKPWPTVAAGAAFGLAVMTKSAAAGLFVPGLLALVVARRGLRALVARDVLWAALAALLVALPWHFEQAFVHGRAFVEKYVVWNLGLRLHQALEQHTGGPLYYLEAYRYNAGWLWPVHAAGVLLALVLALRRRERTLGALAVLVLGAFLGVNSMATKIGWYVVPVYSGAALCTAVALAQVLRSERSRGAACAVALALALAGGIAGRGSMVEDYGVLDFSPEVRQLAGRAPFEARVPKLYVYSVSEPAPHFYLADAVERLDEAGFAALGDSREPFLCLAFTGDAEGLLHEHPESGLEILARSESLALVARRPFVTGGRRPT